MTEEPNLINRLVTDNSLVRLSRGYVVDLWVYDDHFASAKPIKPGDFVSMTNVHAMIHKRTDADPVDQAPRMVELCIHGGGREKYGRGLTVADDSLPAVQRLKLVLSECISDCEDESEYATAIADITATATGETLHSTDAASVSSIAATATGETLHSTDAASVYSNEPVVDVMDVRELSSGCLKRSSRNKKSNAKKKQKMSAQDSRSTAAAGCQSAEHYEAIVLSCSSTSLSSNQSAESASVENAEDRCLLNTYTVVTRDHRDIKHTSLCHVLAREPPYKFRVCADVIKFTPRAELALDIIQLFCSVCKFLSPVPSDVSGDENVNINNSLADRLHHVDNGVSVYTCPHCCPSKRPASRQNVVCLTYVFMLEFVLDDGSGWLSARLWKEEAVKFFHGIEPIELIRHRAKFNEVQQQLNELCSRPSEATAGRRRMECCLMSYSTPCGKAYQIFDTELTLA